MPATIDRDESQRTRREGHEHLVKVLQAALSAGDMEAARARRARTRDVVAERDRHRRYPDVREIRPFGQ